LQLGQLLGLEGDRIKILNDRQPSKGDFVVYWMQATQRTEYNQALDYAIMLANKLDKPLIVYFGITNSFPEANERHYYFMLEGLKEVQRTLEQQNIHFLIQNVSPEIGVTTLSKNACTIIVDRGYTKIERQWRSFVASRVFCPLVQIECNVVVPVEVVSSKEEYSAATLRPKLKKLVTKRLVLNGKKILNRSKTKSDFL